jgi:hypothetical protein
MKDKKEDFVENLLTFWPKQKRKRQIVNKSPLNFSRLEDF